MRGKRSAGRKRRNAGDGMLVTDVKFTALNEHSPVGTCNGYVPSVTWFLSLGFLSISRKRRNGYAVPIFT
jgi:hypothetical protein